MWLIQKSVLEIIPPLEAVHTALATMPNIFTLSRHKHQRARSLFLAIVYNWNKYPNKPQCYHSSENNKTKMYKVEESLIMFIYTILIVVPT
jgi:hypothetical protein